MEENNKKRLFYSHSAINSYPPHPDKFPKFYNCKEEIFVLNPGDVLYIPPRWNHWCFSYPNKNNENIALSYAIHECEIYPECINPLFLLSKPLYYNLNPVLNLSWDTLVNLNIPNKFNFISTKNNIINQINKLDNNESEIITMSINELDLYKKNNNYNISLSMNYKIPQLLNLKPPDIVTHAFRDCKSIQQYAWINLFKNNNEYIDTGLHFDMSYNIIVQLQGTKLVRLFNPNDAKNLYLTPFFCK